jgi:hypothetical protein
VGDVTVVLSKRRRNDSPKQTKVLVTNLPQATAHGTVAIYWGSGSIRAELYVSVLCAMFRWQDHKIHVAPATRFAQQI